MTAPPAPLPSSRPGRRLRLFGWTVAAFGLTAAAVVFFLATAANADPEHVRIVGGQAWATADASADRQSERLGGKVLVRTAEFDHWLRSLLQGRRLAGTLAVVSVAVAAVCLHLAGLADEADAHRD